MNREYVDECLLRAAAQLLPFDPVLIAEVLIDEYRKQAPAMPESTRHILLAVIATLTKHNAIERNSDAVTANVLASLRKKKP